MRQALCVMKVGQRHGMVMKDIPGTDIKAGSVIAMPDNVSEWRDIASVDASKIKIVATMPYISLRGAAQIVSKVEAEHANS